MVPIVGADLAAGVATGAGAQQAICSTAALLLQSPSPHLASLAIVKPSAVKQVRKVSQEAEGEADR